MSDSGSTSAGTFASVFIKNINYIRRKQWEQADEMLREIMEDDPEQPDYHAALGLVLFNRNQDAPPFALIHEHLDRALAASERHERAQLTKGLVLKREGNDAAALKYFQRVVATSPHNLVAAREVRLADSRQRRSSRPKGDDGGFFGKLFKKK